jgi:Queuosine biosynthesis protein QueC
MTKAEIIRTGHALGVDFSLTWSCYEPTADGRPGGLCDSCTLRKKGFAEAGLTDPLCYGAGARHVFLMGAVLPEVVANLGGLALSANSARPENDVPRKRVTY